MTATVMVILMATTNQRTDLPVYTDVQCIKQEWQKRHFTIQLWNIPFIVIRVGARLLFLLLLLLFVFNKCFAWAHYFANFSFTISSPEKRFNSPSIFCHIHLVVPKMSINYAATNIILMRMCRPNSRSLSWILDEWL